MKEFLLLLRYACLLLSRRLLFWLGLLKPRTRFGRICLRRRLLGLRGERVARNALEEYGLEHLASNFRFGHCEIDIVMRDGVEICFIEVKTRQRRFGQQPSDAVGIEKQRRVVRAARGYIRAIGRPRLPFRFDIVEVTYSGRRLLSVNYIMNAFEDGRRSHARAAP